MATMARDIGEYSLHLLQLLMYMLQSTLSTMTMQNCLRTGLVSIEQKIVESAIVFWFKDADCKAENKVVEYLGEY